MRHLKFVFLLILIAGALDLSVVDAQSFHARAVGHYRRGTMFMLDKMADPKEVSGCSRSVLAGKVVFVAYDDQRQIVNFSLQLRNGRIHKVYLPKLLYEQQLPSEAEAGLSKIVAPGKRIRVVAYGCGDAARELEADQIRAL